MELKELIKTWVERFNEGNARALADMYHADAINHQVANEPIHGRDAIMHMFEVEFSQADMTCIVEQLFQDGEWVILEWKDPLGLRGCGFFHITDGKIKIQRGYWDKLSFLKLNKLPLPTE